MRHLTRAFALGTLRRGKQIEQFLGGIQDGDRQGIRWIALGPGRNGIVVYLSEVEDVGTDTFWDITEFPPLDPDEEAWGKQIAVVTTPEEALDLTERELDARPDRWVNQGVTGSEYGDYRAAADSRPRP
jgi:hypothetical protein